MEIKDCELLFEYLRSILYDQPIQALDPETLEEPYRKLGKGMQFLQSAVEEMLEYSKKLSQGNLSAATPSWDNFLCVNLKNLHANLNHLTWQAKQVASGDYSQYVSYLGEFSEAFNTMTMQLKEREEQLKEEAKKQQKRAELIEGYNDLLLELTAKRNEWIIVVSQKEREIIYCNKKQDGTETYHDCSQCENRLIFYRLISEWQENEQGRSWEAEDQGRYYQITSFAVKWKGQNAIAHIIEDITAEKQRTRRLANKAYSDPGTGIHNRLYFEEYMEQVLRERGHIAFCYLDMDGLKYVNDHYGHVEGDVYIRQFVNTIQRHFRSSDIFSRIGGDEFGVILPDCPKSLAIRKLEAALEDLVSNNHKEYPVSFSYGVIELTGEECITLDQVIQKADQAMYSCKKENKRKYHNQ